MNHVYAYKVIQIPEEYCVIYYDKLHDSRPINIINKKKEKNSRMRSYTILNIFHTCNDIYFYKRKI